MSLVYDRKLLPFRQIESYSIVHIKERRFFLNDAGTKIWNLVDGKTTAEDIALRLIKELGIPISATTSVQNRVEVFLSDIFKKGLLILLHGSSSSDDQGQLIPKLEITKNGTQKTVSKGVQAVQEFCMTPKITEEKPKTIEGQIEKLYWDRNYIQKMHVELTYRCNFRCIHCYNTTHGGGTTELTTEEWKRAIDQLAEMGCLLITFTGGEAFVRRDILEIINHACSRGFTFRLNTNGSLVDERAIEHLERMRPFLQSFDISVYGASPEVHDTLSRKTGSYEATMRGLKLLKEAKMPMVAKYVTMRDNFDGIGKFEKDMTDLGIPYVIHTGALIPQTDRSTLPLVQLMTDSQYKKMMSTRSIEGVSEPGNCKPGHVRGAITPDGYVSPCEWLTDMKFGNLREQNLKEIWWESDGFLGFRRRFREESSECPSCSLRPGCSRCPAHSYLETGDIFSCAPIQRHNSELCREIGLFK